MAYSERSCNFVDSDNCVSTMTAYFVILFSLAIIVVVGIRKDVL